MDFNKEIIRVQKFVISDEHEVNYDACAMIDKIVSYIKDTDVHPDGLYYKINGYIVQGSIEQFITTIREELDKIKQRNQKINEDFIKSAIANSTLSLEDFNSQMKKKQRVVGEERDWDSYDVRYNLAKSCKTLSEYRNRYHKAYIISKEKDEIRDFYWFRIEFSYNIYDRVHLVYAYIDKEINTVYVGRTTEQYLTSRIRDHEKYKEDTVYNYYKTLNREVPEVQILLNDLNMEESRYYEDFYIKKFREEGFSVLNSGNTGVGTGSVGALAFKFWTYQTMMTDAFSVDNKIDLHKRTLNGYQNAVKYNWTSDYFWLKLAPNGNSFNHHIETWPEIRIWLFAMLFPSLEKLKKYNTKCYNFIVENNIQHQYFDKNGNVLDCKNDFPEVYEIIRPLYLTLLKLLEIVSFSSFNVYDTFERMIHPMHQYDDCLKNALKCEYRKEFSKSYCMNSMKSLENNWINDYFWFDVSLSSPVKEYERQLLVNETFPEERVWFNVIFYKTKDKLSVKCPSVYNYIVNDFETYYNADGSHKFPSDIRIYERIKDSILIATQKIDIAKNKQKLYYLLYNRYLGAYRYSLRTNDFRSLIDFSAGRHLKKYNWRTDLFWMLSYEKFQDEIYKITNYNEQFCEERLYFNCIFFKNIENLKEFSIDCYRYIIDKNLLNLYFNQNGIALYPKYNEALSEVIDENIKMAKEKLYLMYNHNTNSLIIIKLYKLFQ